MKKVFFASRYFRNLLLFIFVCLQTKSFAQQNITGVILDEANNQPVAGASIHIEGTFFTILSNDEGKFSFLDYKKGEADLIIAHISYETKKIHILSKDSPLSIRLSVKNYLSEEVTITATRMDGRNGLAYSNQNKEDLEKKNLGQDLPFLLNITPSLVVTSDAGNGVGYTGLRIRGSDASRINVTLNGIPVNDPESHQVYWVDLPDLASSVENIQVQRGVGTSTNGAGAFGGSVNIQSGAFQSKAFAQVNSSVGSFNTWKNTVSFGSGLIENKFSVDGRFSKINSGGYIDRSKSDLHSMYLSGGYYGKKSSLRGLILSGNEKTYQAWYGVPEDSLISNPSFNPAGMYTDAAGNILYYENQTDNYQQDYYQLIHAIELSSSLLLNTAVHYTKGKGYYEEYSVGDAFSKYGLPDVYTATDTISSSDFIRRRWLNNDFFGLTANLHYEKEKWNFILGLCANEYDGKHFGEVIWAKDGSVPNGKLEYYSDDAVKKESSGFLKLGGTFGHGIYVYADLQSRFVSYQFIGYDRDGKNLPQKTNSAFFNPKAGMSWQINEKQQFCLSVALAHKEPVRDDYVNSSPDSRPKAEALTDLEAGYRFSLKKFFLSANVYHMAYKDQLILTGEINDVGEYTRQNVADSYRQGIEFEGGWSVSEKVKLSANATFSKNKIKHFEEYIDNYDDYTQQRNDYENTDISFSPSLISAGIIQWTPIKNLEFEFTGKYIGKQFLDNTMNEKRKLDAYVVNDARIAWTIKPKGISEIGLTLAVNNLFDQRYSSNGYTYSYIYGGSASTFNYYFPQAGVTVMFGIKARI